MVRGVINSRALSKEGTAVLTKAHRVVRHTAPKIAKFRDLIAWFFTFGLVGLGMQITMASIRQAGGQPLVIYGNGHQVRDVLYVDDLIDAMVAAQAHIAQVSGQAFNIGGGPLHSTSLLELVGLIASLHGSEPAVTFDVWRIGDQRYYVSDSRKFGAITGWSPRVRPWEGVQRLYSWFRDERPRAAVAP